MKPDFRTASPTALYDLLKVRGWRAEALGFERGLYVMSHPAHARRQLVFPTEDNVPDYGDAVESVLGKLADIEQAPLSKLWAAIGELHDDTLRFRVTGAPGAPDAIPLSYAVTALNSARSLLLSGASTVLRPQLHHPRLSRAEAKQLTDKSWFRHTEQGSFVLSVSTPVRAIEAEGLLYPDTPFVRQTMLAINEGVFQLVQAIRTDRVEALLENLRSQENPVVSSNLCAALSGFQDSEPGYNLNLEFSWAGSIPVPDLPQSHSFIRIQHDYYNRIDDVQRELSRYDAQREETFMATVEGLEGDLDANQNRVGAVYLNLLQEDEIIRARANLNANQYQEANLAHMTAGAYVRVRARLHSGKQPRLLSDISHFELLMP